MKKLTPFTVLGDLNCWRINSYNGSRINNTQKLYTAEQVKEAGLNTYLLLSFIKNCPQLINVALYLNEHHKMKLYDMYLFAFMSFRTLELGAVTWIKSLKYKAPEDVELLMRHYRVSYKDAQRYLDVLDTKDIKEIRLIYNPKAK